MAVAAVGAAGRCYRRASSGLLWAQPASYIGLMTGLVLMPKFFLVMIERLASANIELEAQRDHAEFMATETFLQLAQQAYQRRA